MKRSVLPIKGSVGPFAKGCPTGIRLNVSFTVGIRDKKKTKRKKEVLDITRPVIAFPFCIQKISYRYQNNH